jgi:tetratricopeptide (TPR) repeat protein
MKKLSHFALGVMLSVAGVALVSAPPAVAQKQKSYKISSQESAAILPVQTALEKKDTAAAAAALPAAKAAAEGPDAKLIVGSLTLQLGQMTNDTALQSQGLDMMIDSGSKATGNLPELLKVQANIALEQKNYPKAETALRKLTELTPNDVDITLMLAQMQSNQGRPADALATMQRAIAQQKAAGQQVPENWYRMTVTSAYKAKLVPQVYALSRDWLAAYPGADSWRDSLTIYRELGRPDKPTDIDTLRLMRAAHALKGEADYFDLSDALSKTGFPGETKAVIEEGIANNTFARTKAPFGEMLASAQTRATADQASLPAQEKSALAAASGTPALKMGDAYYGYGNFAKAATLYRAALQKGSVDANLVNTRLGLALAQAGQKAEAEAALKAVTGPRAELASFALLWVSQRS